ncbi:MAG: heavy-metal-associated domain-containing protein [Clostridiales bacterium]|nr:heavy-metal-associated domain-containing protein [Clostridiales bacterium]
MKKIVEIKGMTCEHCQARVDKVLKEIDGISAKVDLKKNRAIVTYSKDVSDQVIKDVIEEAGYEVTSIKEKKGLFG